MSRGKRPAPSGRNAPATRAYVDGRIAALRSELLDLARPRAPPSPRPMSPGAAAPTRGLGPAPLARLAAAQRLGAKVGTRWRLDRGKVFALKAHREP